MSKTDSMGKLFHAGENISLADPGCPHAVSWRFGKGRRTTMKPGNRHCNPIYRKKSAMVR